jgi:tetratricopeptide (TPR) repeat protein
LKRRQQSPKRAPAPAAPRPLSRQRSRLFRIAALFLPLLLLGVAEIALRIGGYGYPTSFFRKTRVGDQECWVNNDTFTLRFFPPELARWPGALMMRAKKPADTTRIFVFGESAAMGDPQPAYGAARFLEVLLRERFPGPKFEIVNTSITAVNSHVILPIARECAARDGDVWIVYMGNNEMVGPFGAATVFGTQAPPLAFVRLNLALQKTRLGQWLVALGRKLRPDPRAAPSWRGMEMFLENQLRPDDPRKESVYRNFQANLEDIVRAGLGSGAKVILNTVAVNLKDCPPFASLANTNRSAPDRAAWAQLYTNAVAAQSAGKWEAASRDFGEAARLDPHAAELQYRWGQCLLALTNVAGARERFQAACDDDALSFRATSRINDTIWRLDTRKDFRNLVLCDAAAILATNSPAQICGEESFYEHVHFNFGGGYRLARVWAAQVEQFLPAATRSRAASGWATQEVCERRLGLTDWNRMFVLQSVMGRMNQPPLSRQSNNGERLRVLAEEVGELRGRQTQPDAVAKARDALKAVMERSPEDPFLHESQANFLEGIGDRRGAIAAYRQLHELLPHDFYACLQLGRLLGEQGQLAEGEALLSRAVKLRPSLPEGWYERGNVLAAQAKLSAALQNYTRATTLRPGDATYVCYAGKVLAKLNRHGEAIAHYRRAIQMRPDYWEARFELAGELAGANQIAEAVKEYAEVARLNPRHALTQVNLGVMLVRVNRLEEAIQRFEEALRLEPGNRAAQDYLAQVQAHLGRRR